METGTITFTNMTRRKASRWNITAGQNITVRNFGGQTRLFHIARSATPKTQPVTVDARGRGLLTIGAMITRSRSPRYGRSPYPAAETSSHRKTCRRRRTYRQHSPASPPAARCGTFRHSPWERGNIVQIERTTHPPRGSFSVSSPDG